MSSKQRRRRAARIAGAAAAREAELAAPTPARYVRPAPGEYQQRDLSGAGSTQLSPVRAMRARDINRPSAADLAEAEAELVIIRRHWQPET